jgi:hypothetical protein
LRYKNYLLIFYFIILFTPLFYLCKSSIIILLLKSLNIELNVLIFTYSTEFILEGYLLNIFETFKLLCNASNLSPSKQLFCYYAAT